MPATLITFMRHSVGAIKGHIYGRWKEEGRRGLAPLV